MKKNNKKGFTLVELLAVIVILAVVVLIAMTAVVPQMNKARVEAFVTEANKFLQGATNYYTDCQLKNDCGTADANGSKMDSSGGCVAIQTLIDNGYIDKKDANNDYKGKIDITINNNAAAYSITLSNGSFYTSKKNANPAIYSLKDSELESDNIVTGAQPSGFKNDCN